jgi:hypothetical protein
MAPLLISACTRRDDRRAVDAELIGPADRKGQPPVPAFVTVIKEVLVLASVDWLVHRPGVPVGIVEEAEAPPWVDLDVGGLDAPITKEGVRGVDVIDIDLQPPE